MARAKCLRCGSPHPDGTQYTIAVEPLGYPNPAIICSSDGCDNPALIWLKPKDEQRFRNGERMFTLAHHAGKVRIAELSPIIGEASAHEAGELAGRFSH
jgi:hypothetical protein